MAEDAGVFHGLPIQAPNRPTGRYSPTVNNHPKQPQQHHSPCTTQAIPPAMTSDQASTASSFYSPTKASSPQRVETFAPAGIPDSSHSLDKNSEETQHGDAGHSMQEMILGDQHRSQEYCSEELQQRVKGMWPSQPIKSEDYDDYGIEHAPASDAGVTGCSSLYSNDLQDGIEHGSKVSPPRSWGTVSQSPLQECLLQPFHSSTQCLDHQSLYYQDRLGLTLPVSDINSQMTSGRYDTGIGNLKRSFETADTDYLNFVTTTNSFQGYQATADSVPTTTLSPCSTSLAFAYEAPQTMRQKREDTVPLSDWDIDQDHDIEYREDLWCPEDSLGGSPPSIEPSGGKVDEPYAQLIYKAFLSRPNRSMTLQEIYKWFRENTDKAKSEGKGWQNSIRHNLSMNLAFTKRNSKAATRDPNDGSLSFDAAVDGRKSTEWYLEPEFYGGVVSTTRYRKGNNGSRRATGGQSRISRLSIEGHGGAGAGYSHARVSAGRKGGNVAAQNRRRQAEKQQQHANAQRMAAMARNDPRNLQVSRFHGAGLPHMQYPGPGFPTAEGGEHYFADYSTEPHPTSQPFPVGFGSVPAAIGDGQAQGQGQGGRQMEFGCFPPSDLAANTDTSKRPQTLKTDGSNSNEPVTPPASEMEIPRSDDGFDHGKHQECLPEMMGSYTQTLVSMAGSGYGVSHGQMPDYSLGDITGVFEGSVAGQQPSVFFDQETVDEAALLAIFEQAHHQP